MINVVRDDDRRVLEKGIGHKKPENNENRREKTTPRKQPARVVLKTSSSASNTAPRITLRTTPKTTPKSPWTMREAPPSRKEISSATRHTISSQRSTPASQKKESSPAKRAKSTIREGISRSTGDMGTGSRQHILAKKAPSVTHRRARTSIRDFSDVIRQASMSSKADTYMTLMLHPKRASIQADSFEDPNSADIFLEDELNIDIKTGESPFYADGELSGDDFESKVRSYLGRRDRVSRRSEIKAVEWDPAIVSCGPLSSVENNARVNQSPNATLSQKGQYIESTKHMKTSLDDLNQIAADLKKADRRILQQLLNALKDVDSSDDTTIFRPLKKRAPLGEQRSKVKENSQTTTQPANWQRNKNTTSAIKGLNPEAPVYRNFAALNNRFSPQKENKENVPQGGKWPLKVQRKRPHSTEDRDAPLYDPAKPNKYIPPALRTRKTSPAPLRQELEPIWVRRDQLPSDILNHGSGFQQGPFQHVAETYESLIDAPLDPFYALQPPLLAQAPPVVLNNQPILLPSWLTGFQNAYQPLISQSGLPLGSYEGYTGFDIQPNAVPCPSYLAPIIPLPGMPLQHTQQNHRDRYAYRSDKVSKVRTKRLPPNVIPSESEPGRTAVALEPAWASQVLDKFVAKYPWTGKIKPLPKLTKEKKFATKIQHKLEVLLLQQKEKKAMEEWFDPMPMFGVPRMASEISSGSGLTDSFDALSVVSA